MKIEVWRAAAAGFRQGSGWWAFCLAMRRVASRFAPLANWRNNSPCLRKLFERVADYSARRRVAGVAARMYSGPTAAAIGPADGREVVLFADTSTAPMSAKISTPRCACWSKPVPCHLPKPAEWR